MMRELSGGLVISLALTLLLESIFFFVSGKREKKDYLLLILVNLLTNPITVMLYIIISTYTRINPWLIKTALEIFVVLAEWQYYKKYAVNILNPLFFSIAANMFSFFMGLVIRQLI